MEEGEKEKLQQNGEASSLALGKVDAGEGELMLSPAQTPQVRWGGGVESRTNTVGTPRWGRRVMNWTGKWENNVQIMKF